MSNYDQNHMRKKDVESTNDGWVSWVVVIVVIALFVTARPIDKLLQWWGIS